MLPDGAEAARLVGRVRRLVPRGVGRRALRLPAAVSRGGLRDPHLAARRRAARGARRGLRHRRPGPARWRRSSTASTRSTSRRRCSPRLARSPAATPTNLTWIESPIETATLEPPYGLVVAGESVHWFDWELALPRFAERARARRRARACLPRLDPCARARRRGSGRSTAAHAAKTDFTRTRRRRGARRGGIGSSALGEQTTAPEPWRPTLDELIGCHHSQSGFVLEKMRRSGRIRPRADRGARRARADARRPLRARRRRDRHVGPTELGSAR